MDRFEVAGAPRRTGGDLKRVVPSATARPPRPVGAGMPVRSATPVGQEGCRDTGSSQSMQPAGRSGHRLAPKSRTPEREQHPGCRRPRAATPANAAVATTSRRTKFGVSGFCAPDTALMNTLRPSSRSAEPRKSWRESACRWSNRHNRSTQLVGQSVPHERGHEAPRDSWHDHEGSHPRPKRIPVHRRTSSTVRSSDPMISP